MDISTPSKILAVNVLGGGRSYVLVFSTADASFEVFLAAAWPESVDGFMTPGIRNQVSGESAELPWPEAEKLAVALQPLTDSPGIAGGDQLRARGFVQALLSGKRVGAS